MLDESQFCLVYKSTSVTLKKHKQFVKATGERVQQNLNLQRVAYTYKVYISNQ